MNRNAPFEHDLEQWLQAEAPARAPDGLHAAVIDRARTMRQRPGWATSFPPLRFGRGRGLTLLAAAMLVVGGAMATGSGLVQLPSVVPPEPAPSLILVPTPSPVGESARPKASASAGPTGTRWITTGTMRDARYWHAATLLNDGTVLVTGGYSGTIALSSAERYDPRTGTWTSAGQMILHAGTYYTATLLLDGRVLVAGGRGPTGALASAELYDPATGLWTITGGLITPRWYSTATLLRDGKVLVAGGGAPSSQLDYLASAELYDPATGSWTETGRMTVRRNCPLATLLQDGRVLVAGGASDAACAIGPLSSAEIYDPATGRWTATGSMHAQIGDAWAALLHDGRVLVPGDPSSQLYDPASGSWTSTGGGLPGNLSTGTVLRDGRVLVAGAFSVGDARAGLYDPLSGVWSATAFMTTPRPRGGHTATLLNDGRVLVAGGFSSSDPLGSTLASAELYDPGTGE